MGLKVIKDLVTDPRFTPPSSTDEYFHVKEQFYRPPQFIAKGLAWYYGIDAVSTHDQVTQLVATNHMSHGVAHSFKAVMSVMAKYRFRLHLDREGEKDFVFTKPGKARWGARDPQREEPCFAHGGGKGATHTAHGRYPDDARGSERPDRRNPKPRFHHGARANLREREGEGPGEARKSFRVTEGGSCDRTGGFTLGVNLEVGS